MTPTAIGRRISLVELEASRVANARRGLNSFVGTGTSSQISGGGLSVLTFGAFVEISSQLSSTTSSWNDVIFPVILVLRGADIIFPAFQCVIVILSPG